MHLEKLQEHAKRFRNAIIINSGNLRSFSLSEFPRGSCGDISTLLGLYLESGFGIDVEYVAGVKGEQHHAWIQYQGLIIDITADQFDGMDIVIAEPISEWHQGFNIWHKRRPCIDTEIPEHRKDLEHDFKLLCATAREMA